MGCAVDFIHIHTNSLFTPPPPQKDNEFESHFTPPRVYTLYTKGARGLVSIREGIGVDGGTLLSGGDRDIRHDDVVRGMSMNRVRCGAVKIYEQDLWGLPPLTSLLNKVVRATQFPPARD